MLPKRRSKPPPPSTVSSSKRPKLVQTAFGGLLVLIGVGFALALYRWAGGGEFFSWTVATPHSPLVAVLIGGASAALLGLWILNSLGKLNDRHTGRALMSISLIWVGFGAGLFGPAVLGIGGPGKNSEANSSNVAEDQIHVFKLNFYREENVTVIITNPSNFGGLFVTDARGDSRATFLGSEDLEIISEQEPRFCRGTDDSECSSAMTVSFPWDDEGVFIVGTSYDRFPDGLAKHNSDTAIFTYRSEIHQDDECPVGIVFPDLTWMAYNNWGGRSLYSRPEHLPGNPGSNVGIGQRPIAFGSTVHSPEATLIYAAALDEAGICNRLLSNSDLHDSEDWMNLELIILTGHDEYWSLDVMNKLERFVETGGRLSVFSGNTAWWQFNRFGLDAYQRTHRWDIERPVERLIGLSWRYGGLPGSSNFTDSGEAEKAGLPVGLFEFMNGMKVLVPTHPIFHETGLERGQFFGYNTNLLFHEIDGVPLNPGDDSRDLTRLSWSPLFDDVPQSFPVNQKILASAWVIDPRDREFLYVGTIVESKIGAGTVLNFGSVGWSQSLRSGDDITKAIFLNSVSWQLSKGQ